SGQEAAERRAQAAADEGEDTEGNGDREGDAGSRLEAVVVPVPRFLGSSVPRFLGSSVFDFTEEPGDRGTEEPSCDGCFDALDLPQMHDVMADGEAHESLGGLASAFRMHARALPFFGR